MKGEKVLINGDTWTIVDVAPAPELAEMVAVLLEEESIPTMTRSAGDWDDVLGALGAQGIGATCELVPEVEGYRAIKLISELVTDFEGEELEALLDDMATSTPPEDADAAQDR
jgi:hypothetical protein